MIIAAIFTVGFCSVLLFVKKKPNKNEAGDDILPYNKEESSF